MTLIVELCCLREALYSKYLCRCRYCNLQRCSHLIGCCCIYKVECCALRSHRILCLIALNPELCNARSTALDRENPLRRAVYNPVEVAHNLNACRVERHLGRPNHRHTLCSNLCIEICVCQIALCCVCKGTILKYYRIDLHLALCSSHCKGCNNLTLTLHSHCNLTNRLKVKELNVGNCNNNRVLARLTANFVRYILTILDREICNRVLRESHLPIVVRLDVKGKFATRKHRLTYSLREVRLLRFWLRSRCRCTSCCNEQK